MLKAHPDLTDVYDCIGVEMATMGLELLPNCGKLSGPAGTPEIKKEGVQISNTLFGDVFGNPETQVV
jgi:hypothetical protein